MKNINMGKLIVITGPMFSGKTSRLIELLEREILAEIIPESDEEKKRLEDAKNRSEYRLQALSNLRKNLN